MSLALQAFPLRVRGRKLQRKQRRVRKAEQTIFAVSNVFHQNLTLQVEELHKGAERSQECPSPSISPLKHEEYKIGVTFSSQHCHINIIHTVNLYLWNPERRIVLFFFAYVCVLEHIWFVLLRIFSIDFNLRNLNMLGDRKKGNCARARVCVCVCVFSLKRW